MLKVGARKFTRDDAVELCIYHDGGTPARPMEEHDEGAFVLRVDSSRQGLSTLRPRSARQVTCSHQWA